MKYKENIEEEISSSKKTTEEIKPLNEVEKLKKIIEFRLSLVKSSIEVIESTLKEIDQLNEEDN